MSRLTTTLACMLAAQLTALAMQAALDPRAVSEAIAIGQTRADRDRARFHAPYRLVVGKPPVDAVEVITPFRRVELVAEARAQVGDRTFSQRQALEMLSATPPGLEVQVEFTFHPLNTYVGVPDYVISLIGRDGVRVRPDAIDRTPRYGARVEGSPLPLPVPGGLIVPKESQPMLGGTVTARFDLRAVVPDGQYDVVIDEAKKELARVRASLERMR